MMNAEPSNAELMRSLGRIEEGQKHASEGRKVLHDRMDHQAEQLADLTLEVRETSARVGTLQKTVAEDMRPRLEIADQFREDTEPLIEIVRTIHKSLRTIKWLIWAIVGALAVLGITAGALFAWINEIARTGVLRWLGLM